MSRISMMYDVIRWEEKALAEAAKKKGIELNMVDSKEVVLNLSQSSEKFVEQYGKVALQRCVSYFRLIHFTAALESKGIKVVNDLKTALVAGNKLFTTVALLKAGIPTPRTMLSFTPESSMKALEEVGYPAVLKPTIGSWGRLLAILKDKESADSILEGREHMFPLYQVYYIQEMVKRPPRDLRAFVVGDRVVAAIYRVSTTGDWRTNTARGGKAVNCPITNELEDLCLKAAKAVGEGIFGVDLMESEDGLVVHEVNNNTEFKNTVPATGVDIPGIIVDYVTRP